MGEMRNTYRILVGKPEENKPLGRPSRRWEDNIRIDIREVGWEIVDWIHLPQYRDTVMNCRVQQEMGNLTS
jgi:hypothetical protein